jgi:hypothetical protein
MPNTIAANAAATRKLAVIQNIVECRRQSANNVALHLITGHFPNRLRNLHGVPTIATNWCVRTLRALSFAAVVLGGYGIVHLIASAL